jgi:hypothetical protein
MSTQTPATAVAEVKPELKSAAPIGELTPAQRKQRYEQLRVRMGKSKLEVKGDPKLHYFWAHKSDGGQIIEFESKDYHIVKEPNATKVLSGEAKPKIIANGLQQDGTYVVGDIILMACPLEVYEFLLLDQDEQMAEMKRAAKDDFRVEAERAGAPTFEFDTPRRK